MQTRYNLELLSGISVMVSIASVVLMTALMLPNIVHRGPVSDASSGIAASVLPPAITVR